MKKPVIAFLSLVACTISIGHNSSTATDMAGLQYRNLPDFFRYSFSGCLEAIQADKYSPNHEKCHGELNGFSEELYMLPEENSQIPLIKISRKNHDQDRLVRDFFLYIHGGPLYSFPRLYEYEDKYKGLGDNQVVYMPLYLGTWFRSTGDGARDLAGAVPEVQAALSSLRATHPNARVHIIGQSWGSYIASRLELFPKDHLILESAPLNHTGKSLLKHFFETTNQKRRDGLVSFPLDASNYYNQLSLKRFDYVNSALNYVGDEPFVRMKGNKGNVCLIIIYGSKDPMVSDFHKPSGYYDSENEWIVRRETGHDVLEGYDSYFAKIGETDCE